MRPLVVVEGTDADVDRAVTEVRDAGWQVGQGFPAYPWRPPPEARVARVGVVRTHEDAAAAVLAAVGGCGLVVAGRADREVLDRLCDDLRRLGPVDHRLPTLADTVGGGTAGADELTAEERALLVHLAEGLSLGEAAARLHVSRRTADRRLASARRRLGVDSAAEAVVRLQRGT